jgi:ABC-type uncharacterized transport system involved in gliding motility auxiliary subunit
MSDAPTVARPSRGGRKPKPRFAVSPDTLKGPLAVLGVLLLLAGGGYYVIFASFDTTARILTAAGILLVGIAISIDPEAIWSKITARNMLYGGNTVAMAAIFIGILVFVNVLGARQPKRWDLTANKNFSLSEETLNVLNQVQQPIQAIAFYASNDDRRRDLEDQLREFQIHSNGNFTYQFVDPVQSPGYAQQLGVNELGTTVLTMGDQKTQVTGSTEADITTGIVKLVQPNPRKVYFTTGHGEKRIDSSDPTGYAQIKMQLDSRNLNADTLSLLTTPDVPADANAVVIAGPTRPFTQDEVNALSAYVDKGGNLMILVDPGVDSGLNPLLSRWGVQANQAFVVERDPRFTLQSPFLPVVTQFPTQKVTDRLSAVVFITPTFITTPQTPPNGATITPLAKTSSQSWGETDQTQLKDLNTLKMDPGVDTPGPLTLAVSIEQSSAPSTPPIPGAPPPPADDSPKPRVVVIGTSQIVTNQMFSQLGGQVDNSSMFVNGLTWLVHDDQLISIKPKPVDNRTLTLTGAQSNFVLLSTILMLPAIVLGAGIIVWWSRR